MLHPPETQLLWGAHQDSVRWPLQPEGRGCMKSSDDEVGFFMANKMLKWWMESNLSPGAAGQAILILILFSDMEKEAIQPAAKQSSSSTAASCTYWLCHAWATSVFNAANLSTSTKWSALHGRQNELFCEDFTEKWKEMEINQVLLCGVFLNNIAFFFQK